MLRRRWRRGDAIGVAVMVDSVFMAELSWPEFESKTAARVPFFLPFGATEQHGPHLPLGVDVVLPVAVCERVARELGGVVAPPIAYGYKSQTRSGGGESFPGTTSLESHTLVLLTRDVVYALAMKGVRRLVAVNGHFENAWPVLEGIDCALRELRRDGVTDIAVMRMSYWDLVRPQTLERIFPNGYPGIDLEHASLLETSLMLALRPDLVDLGKIPADGPGRFPGYDLAPGHAGYLPPSGVLADARGSSAEIGASLLEDHVTLISEAVRREFGL
jgi:creatinine amidohydrolase